MKHSTSTLTYYFEYLAVLHVLIYRGKLELVKKTTSNVFSFAAVIRVVTQCSWPTNGCSLELCILFPLSLRTNYMHVIVSSCTNHISGYICRQRSRFPRNGSLWFAKVCIMHLTFCLCSLNSFIDNGVMAFPSCSGTPWVSKIVPQTLSKPSFHLIQQ